MTDIEKVEMGLGLMILNIEADVERQAIRLEQRLIDEAYHKRRLANESLYPKWPGQEEAQAKYGTGIFCRGKEIPWVNSDGTPVFGGRLDEQMGCYGRFREPWK